MEIRYAISDIHGEARAFLKLLDHVDPDPEELIVMGDLCNRGLDSWGVFEECAQLVDEGTKFLWGNHDVWLNQYMHRQFAEHTFKSPEIGGSTTLKSIELAYQKHGQGKVEDTLQKIWRAMEIYHETDDYIFVHAGLDPRIPFMANQKPGVLQGLEKAFDWANPKIVHTFDQTVVFGHTPTWNILKNITPEEPTVWFSRNAKKMAIDTGSGFWGRLTMVDLYEGKAYAYDFESRKIIEYAFMKGKDGKWRG